MGVSHALITAPIILSTETIVQRKKHFQFRFYNFWFQYKQLDQVVIPQYWQTPVQGTRMYKLTQKLKYVKNQVKGWSKQFFGNSGQKLAQNENKLNMIEEKLLEQSDSPRLNAWMNRLIRQREKLLLFNQKYLRKLKRKEWLVNGDRNSKYFQRRANTRGKKKWVVKLKDDCGMWIKKHRT